MHRVLAAGRLPAEQGPGGLSCQHIVLAALFTPSAFILKQLFATQLLFWLLQCQVCNMYTQPGTPAPDGACMQVPLLDHPYSQGEAQMLTGVL
jgi:hypothetical protein